MSLRMFFLVFPRLSPSHHSGSSGRPTDGGLHITASEMNHTTFYKLCWVYNLQERVCPYACKSGIYRTSLHSLLHECTLCLTGDLFTCLITTERHGFPLRCHPTCISTSIHSVSKQVFSSHPPPPVPFIPYHLMIITLSIQFNF